MKKRIPTFLAGVLTTILTLSLAATAFAAAGGTVSFNSVNLRFNGKQISAKGEDFTIGSGASVPSSILYTDENGGGTTYLPIARVSELLGVEIGWDGETGSVRIGEDPNVSNMGSPSINSAADIKTYDDFKSVITLRKNENMEMFADEVVWCGVRVNTKETDVYYAQLPDWGIKGLSNDQIAYLLKTLPPLLDKYGEQYISELHVDGRNTLVSFRYMKSSGDYSMMRLMSGDIVADTID